MKNQSVRIGLIIFVAFINFAGNAVAEIDITNQVKIERIPHEDNIYIASVRVLQDGDKIIVRGMLKLNRHPLTKFEGHVDVAIISPDGNSTNSTSVSYKPRFRSTKSRRKAYRNPRFKACFSGEVLKGSTIRISLHKSE